MAFAVKLSLGLAALGLLSAVFLAWQSPAMALVLSAIRYCF